MYQSVYYDRELLQKEVSYDPGSGFFWYNGSVPRRADTSQGVLTIHSERLNAASAAYAYMTGEYHRFVLCKDGDHNNLKYENLEI